MTDHTTDSAPRRFVFLLLPGLSLIAFSGAIECLRIANRMAGRAIYEWRMISHDGLPVRCSGGLTLPVDGPLEELRRTDTILACGGLDISAAADKTVLNWLRREARRGCVVGGLCTAAHVLARAGLLDDRRAAVHWENHDAFLEDFPNIELTKAVFAVDRNRLTCAGGTSSIDLLLTLIADDHGRALANEVADQMIYSTIRTDKDTQRLSVPTRIGVRHPKLSDVVARMEENIEDPVSPATLAAEVGLSTRQLERLFRRYLRRSPKRYYMELRLAKARNLLMQTDMSVISVALACGFTSPSHFSKCYRGQYNTTPYRERGSQKSQTTDA